MEIIKKTYAHRTKFLKCVNESQAEYRKSVRDPTASGTRISAEGQIIVCSRYDTKSKKTYDGRWMEVT